MIFLISKDDKEYFYVGEAAGHIYWRRGWIGKKDGERVLRQPLYDLYEDKLILCMFPDGDLDVIEHCPKLSFRELGYYLAQSVGFT